MNKIKKISTVLVLIVTITASFMPIISNAAEKKVTIYGSERYGDLLKRNGLDLVCIPLSYKENGQEHPVYCLNLQKDGATEKFSYDVNLDSEITDMELWRTVVNGYPYKTPEELGCKTKEEAYLATRHAIYCAIYQRDPESYYSHGTEASDRTLNAMKNIVKIARTGTETKQSSRLTINSNDKIWAIDKVNSNYVSKEFSVTALAAMPEYSVNLTGNLVEEIKITDVNNKKQNTFKNGEKFKILIPIKNLNQDGNFEINVTGKVATKPVIVGNPDNTKLQNVAITGSIYEDGQGSRKEYYFQNQTKVVILKQNQETKEPIQGVKFKLLDANKKVIYTELKTDENGLITIENLLPGKYFVVETETIPGYIKYEKEIQIDIKLNEETKITINNLKDKTVPEIDKTKTELEVEQEVTEIEVKQEQTNISKTTEEVDNIKEIEKINNIIVKEKITNNITKLPKTGM